MRTESKDRPTEFCQFFKDTERNFVIFNNLESVEEVETEDGVKYVYDTYHFKTSANQKYVEDNAEYLYGLVKQAEYDKLANEIREKRNRLLDESDKYMALDRLDLDTSSALKFLASLTNIFKNNYATYRQQLRDITKQPNFPYDVVFPKKPE